MVINPNKTLNLYTLKNKTVVNYTFPVKIYNVNYYFQKNITFWYLTPRKTCLLCLPPTKSIFGLQEVKEIKTHQETNGQRL